MHAVIRALFTCVVVAFVGFVSVGCASRPVPADASGRPADFSLDVSVMSSDDGELRARWARPARYVVEPGGALRVSAGEGAAPDVYPPRIRIVSAAEVDRLWRLTVESRLVREDSPLRIDAPERLGRVGGPPLAVVTVTDAGKRRSIAVFLDGGDDDAENARLLIDRLAELSWIRQ